MAKIRRQEVPESIIQTVYELLDGLSPNQIATVSDAVHVVWKEEIRKQEALASRRFSVGDSISWSKDRRTMRGKVTSVNQRTVSSTDQNGGRWRIAFSHVKKEASN